MQLIDDDMDALFRRAAEEYPLETDSADWNKVAAKLHADRNKKFTINWYPFLFVLVLGCIWAGNTFISFIGMAPSPKAAISPSIVISRPSVEVEHKDVKHQDVSLPANISSNNHKESHTINHLRNTNNIIRNSTTSGAVVLTELAEKTSVNDPEDITTSFTRMVNTQRNSILAVPTILTAIPFHMPEPHKTKEKTSQKTSQHYFYYGVSLSIDFSNVKMQHYSNAGFGAGVILGYALNKKLNIETGLMYDQKSYYSEGKYFNPKIYPNVNIESLQGVCNMYELPVSLQYKLNEKFYLGAGISSYIMKKENYNFDYIVNNRQYYSSRVFNNSSTNLLSVITVNPGFQTALGKSLKLRVEPYVKIPVQQVGIGKLPISSAGLNLGIVKSVF